MEKTPNIVDISGNAFNQERPLDEAAADLGALVLKKKQTKRMTELAQLAEVQERVIHRLLDRAIEKPTQPKRPHLTIVK